MNLSQYNRKTSTERYNVDGSPLNLGDKSQKQLGLKDTFRL